MQTYNSFNELPGASPQEGQNPQSLFNMSPSITRSYDSLPNGDYKFQMVRDAKIKDGINIVGIPVNQNEEAFFVAVDGQSQKVVYFDEQQAQKAMEALTVKSRIEKRGKQ